jgi:hypothetical protein
LTGVLSDGAHNITVTTWDLAGNTATSAALAFTLDTGMAALVDYAVLQFPPSVTITSGESTGPIFGRVFEAGLTEQMGPVEGIVAQLGYGTFGTDPTSDANWTWLSATYGADVGNEDEYQATITDALDPGQYSYTYRFGLAASGDEPGNWLYADLNGTGDGFDIGQLGQLTVFA